MLVLLNWVKAWFESDSWAQALIVFCGLVAVASLVGLVIDSRVLDEAPVWLKPLKFSLSIAIYTLTLGWLCSVYPNHTLIRWLVRSQALLLTVELVLIALQAARGVQSHFNLSSPLNASIFGVMGVAIGVVALLTIVMTIAIIRQPVLPVLVHRALVAGLVLSLAGMLQGYRMTSPTPAQIEGYRVGIVRASGSHHVGAHQPGSGLPIVGWSTTAGDWRLAHFIGLHGLQLLLLLAAALQPLQTKSLSWPRLVLWVAIALIVALFVTAFYRTSQGLPGAA